MCFVVFFSNIQIWHVWHEYMSTWASRLAWHFSYKVNITFLFRLQTTHSIFCMVLLSFSPHFSSSRVCRAFCMHTQTLYPFLIVRVCLMCMCLDVLACCRVLKIACDHLCSNSCVKLPYCHYNSEDLRWLVFEEETSLFGGHVNNLLWSKMAFTLPAQYADCQENFRT